MKLISMTDFVFLLRNKTTSELCRDYPNSFRTLEWNVNQSEMVKQMLAIYAMQWKLVGEYAKFISQPLKLEMFVPCDKDGNVLEEPYDEIGRGNWIKTSEKIISEMSDKYEQAKEKVLFENYSVVKQSTYYIIVDSHGRNVWLSWNKSKTIESLINEVTEVSLTPNAIKQLGL